jgi:hypothetical protein
MSEPSGVSRQQDHATYAAQTLVEKGLDKDWEVFVATDFTLLLDIDKSTLPDNFDRLMSILEDQVGLVIYEMSTSKSDNLHVVITMKNPMDIIERIAWQTILGSDQVSGALHLGSVKRNELNPILLFQRKAQRLLTAGEYIEPADTGAY